MIVPLSTSPNLFLLYQVEHLYSSSHPLLHFARMLESQYRTTLRGQPLLYLTRQQLCFLQQLLSVELLYLHTSTIHLLVPVLP